MPCKSEITDQLNNYFTSKISENNNVLLNAPVDTPAESLEELRKTIANTTELHRLLSEDKLNEALKIIDADEEKLKAHEPKTEKDLVGLKSITKIREILVKLEKVN